MRYILIFLIIFFLTGCKSKINTVETVRIDTVIVTKVIKIQPQQLNGLSIASPCDSLGRLKPFNYSFGSGNTKTVLKSLNGTIYLEQNIDSIVSSEIETYKNSISKDKQIIIKTKTPKWAWWMLSINLLIGAFFVAKWKFF